MSSYLSVRWAPLSSACSALATGKVWRVVGALLGAMSVIVSVTGAALGDDPAYLSTYHSATGEVYFAMSVRPDGPAPKQSSHDVIVLVDTSASQTGAYRDDALASVKHLMSGLDSHDRVEIMAVDLDAVSMSGSFASPRSAEADRGLALIQQRAPLGSTDMLRVINQAADRFETDSNRPRSIVYIGDGMSRANMLETTELTQLVRRLADGRISVSSFAVGPGQDVALLATLANHTGGNLFLDGADVSAQQAGSALASFVHGAVAWPITGQPPQSILESYPARFPPLRWDRDTVVVGTMNDVDQVDVAFQAKAAGQVLDLNWKLAARNGHEDHAFLTRLVELARRDGGLSLPTLGTAGLAQAERALNSTSQQLTQLGQQAMASGDVEAAETLTTAALRNDPSNLQAELMRAGLHRSSPASDVRVAQLNGDATLVAPARESALVDGGQDIPSLIIDEGEIILDGGSLPPAGTELEGVDGRYIDDVMARRKAQESYLNVLVRNGLVDGRKRMNTDPQSAVSDLKLLLEDIRNVSDISAEIRSQLVARMESGIREGMRRQIEKEERDALAAGNRARAEERSRLGRKAERRDEEVKQLLDRFNALMDEGLYHQSEHAAVESRRVAPDLPITEQAVVYSGMAASYHRLNHLRELKTVNWLNALALVEESHIPFPDEPAIVYPDAKFWEYITIKREKWKAADLAEPGTAEERIFGALNEETELDYLETPLADVIDDLQDIHDIPIKFDQTALEDLVLDQSVPVTMQLSGIKLKSALRLMLGDLDLTYVIENEVLLITSQENAEDAAITKVYPVADLVLPIISGGGMGGGMMGGGMGGMGGGFGGGGFGGGGFFNVQDDFRAFAVDDSLRLGVSPTNGRVDSENNTSLKPDASFFEGLVESQAQPKVIRLSYKDGLTLRQSWDRFFGEQTRLAEDRRAAPGDVRATVRYLKRHEKLDEVQALILSALAHGFPQPWMYEALGIAMKTAGAPASEIERALMSAVDFSHDVDEVYFIAAYMSRIGLEERALHLFREVAVANPTRPEPYVHALKLARRLDDLEAIQWACLGVLAQAWPKELAAVEQQTDRISRLILLELNQAGEVEAAAEFKAALQAAQQRDCVATVTWTGDADVDLLVEEPAGTVCSLRNPRTTSGGVVLGDAFATDESRATQGVSETYVCAQGFSGQYRLLVRPIWGEVSAGRVTVEVTTHHGTEQSYTIRKQIPLGDSDVAVVFDLHEGRLTEPLADHQVAQSVHKQLAVNHRAVLAQQIDNGNSTVLADLVNARRLAAAFGGPLIVQPVGFRPEITQLPEGTNFSAQAVISADRRYVRITPSPMFSLVTDVFTFNFVSGEGAQQEGGAAGGGGGGFGGGGGGMGGGMMGGGMGGGMGGMGGGF